MNEKSALLNRIQEEYHATMAEISLERREAKKAANEKFLSKRAEARRIINERLTALGEAPYQFRE